MHPLDKLTLEGLVDKYTMKVVICELGEMAKLKSEHVLDNWQDRPMASMWGKIGNRLNQFGHSLPGWF